MKDFNRRNLLTAGLGLGAVAVLGACSGQAATPAPSGAPSPLPIKVGYIADYNGAALLAVADKQGFWAKAGLKPEFVPFTNGPLAIQALGTNNVDVAYIGSGALWLPASGKAEIWAINSVSNADRIIAQPGVTSLADLKGKKIGVPAGTSGDQLLSLALKKDGLQRSDFNIVPMDPSTAVSAFASKQIDGAALWYPLIDTIKARIPEMVELAKNEDYVSELTFPSTYVAQPGRAQKDKELATRFIGVVKASNDYRQDNQAATITATAGFLKLGEEVLKPQAGIAKTFISAELEKLSTDGTVGKWLTGLQEQFVTDKKLTAVTSPDKFYDSALYANAKMV